jgi:hypothetical protein
MSFLFELSELLLLSIRSGQMREIQAIARVGQTRRQCEPFSGEFHTELLILQWTREKKQETDSLKNAGRTRISGIPHLLRIEKQARVGMCSLKKHNAR